MASEPHPDAQAFLDQTANAPDLHTLPVAEARAVHRELNIPEGEPERVANDRKVVDKRSDFKNEVNALLDQNGTTYDGSL